MLLVGSRGHGAAAPFTSTTQGVDPPGGDGPRAHRVTELLDSHAQLAHDWAQVEGLLRRLGPGVG